LNGLIPNTIVIKDIRECDSDFHARYDAISRRYRYYISRVPTAINRTFMWQAFFPLNYVLMQIGAQRIKSITDFKSFCKTNSELKHYRCNITESTWFFFNDSLIFEIIANRFLHGMVRAIVGSLIELGRGQISLDEFEHMIKAKDRRTVPYSAPAHGLVLEDVIYS
jgi:tRNA pseudouridine38-40 synthase